MNLLTILYYLRRKLSKFNLIFGTFFGSGGIDFDFWFEIYNDSFPFLGFAEALDGCHFKQPSLQICKN